MTPLVVVSVALNLLAALVWAVMGRQLREFLVVARPQSLLFRLAPVFMGVVACQFLVHAGLRVLPGDPARATAGPVVVLRLLAEASALASLLLGVHMLRLMPIRAERTTWWLVALDVWTPATFVVAVALRARPDAVPSATALADALTGGTAGLLAVLLVAHGIRLARPGPWGPESAGEMRRPDMIVIAAGMGVALLAGLACVVAGQPDLARAVVAAGVGIAIAMPWTLRMLGVFVPELIVSVALGLALAGLLAVAVGARPAIAGSFRPLFDLGVFLVLGFVAVPGQRWLRVRATRLVLGRSQRELSTLRAFLQTLSPELGAAECCRRALAELVRVRRLDGAAILLDDGDAIVHGSFDLAPLLGAWPRGADADALPAGSYGTIELRRLPLALREALIAANVGLGVSAIATPRRRWGHLFMRTGLLRGTFSDEDLEEFRAFVSQLALLLDAADLLARAVAVERSLAHAEKLAAIGETAARIAHEIRNPVTAARSLAQQLAREPASPLNAEHAALILAELERVEHQVGALLRFARREELRLEPTDLAELARATLDAYGHRLDAAGIRLSLDTGAGIVARVDQERLRQVLVNLLDNAIDALGERAGDRCLRVAVSGLDGTATVEVADNGPGVPAEAVDRLFEPFFSLKAQGTGLGLAIARRTVEAHGGAISAGPAPEGGLRFRVELPIARA